MKRDPKPHGVPIQIESYRKQNAQLSPLLFICVVAFVLWFALGLFKGMSL